MDVLSILLRLQRICNHPGLVEPRLPESSYTAGPLRYRSASLILKALDGDSWKVRVRRPRFRMRRSYRGSGRLLSALSARASDPPGAGLLPPTRRLRLRSARGGQALAPELQGTGS